MFSFARQVRKIGASLFMAALLLAGCTQSAPYPQNSSVMADARLGTQLGEDVNSRVSSLHLRRSQPSPLDMSVLPYSAAPARGSRVNELLLAKGNVGMRVLHENGSPWPIHRQNGSATLRGQSGERYMIEYRNHSRTVTYEIVATVDGLDVLSGKRGSVQNRGYVLRPGAVLRIEGFRKNSNEVAAFRFSKVEDSYAANTSAGSIANVGVIGTAVFGLRAPVGDGQSAVPCKDLRCAFPADRPNADEAAAVRQNGS